MPTHYYLVLSFVLFLIGTCGVLLRRNALIVLMGIELQLNGGNLAMLAFSRALGDLKGHVFAFLIIALAAAEAAVGLLMLFGRKWKRDTVTVIAVGSIMLSCIVVFDAFFTRLPEAMESGGLRDTV